MASASQHARHTRYDLHRLDAAEKLASGALRVPARVARVGVLDYTDADGNTWGELVPAETLFAVDSMATLRAVAATDLHPGDLVTPLTRKGLQVGHVSDVITRDGDYLATTVYITDAAEIELVQSGKRKDVSCGYTCDLDETPGTFEGKPYRAIQRARIYNHLGIGPEGWGRAGSDVGLRLDGADETAESGRRAPVARLDSGDAHASVADTQGALPGAQKTSTTTDTTGRAAATTAPAKGAQRSAMAQPKTNSTTCKDGDEPTPMDPKKTDAEGDEMVPKKDADAMVAEQVAKIAALDALVNALSKQLGELKATMASEESAEVTEEDVPETVADSIVSKRLAKLVSATTDAKFVAPAVKLDGLVSTRKVHEAALAIATPEIKLDGLSDDRVAGMFDALAAGARKAAEKGNRSDSNTARTVRNDALGNAHRAAAVDPNAAEDDSAEAAYRKMREDSRDAWRHSKPALSVSTTIKAD